MITEPLDTCRICMSACTYCAEKRAAAKTLAELGALREPPSTQELCVPLGEFIAWKPKAAKAGM